MKVIQVHGLWRIAWNNNRMPHQEQQVICPKGFTFRVKQVGPFHAHVYLDSLSQSPAEEPRVTFEGHFLLTRSVDQRFRCADCVSPHGCRMGYKDEIDEDVCAE